VADQVFITDEFSEHKSALKLIRGYNKAALAHGPKTYPWTRLDDATQIIEWWRKAFFIVLRDKSGKSDREVQLAAAIIWKSAAGTEWPVADIFRMANDLEDKADGLFITDDIFRSITKRSEQRARQWRLFATAMQQSLVAYRAGSAKMVAGAVPQDGFSYLPPRETAVFWDGLHAAALTLDTFATREAMPSIDFKQVHEGVKAAVRESGEAVGVVTAQTAEFAAEVAGKTVKGFLSEVGILTIAVAGGAFVLYWKVL